MNKRLASFTAPSAPSSTPTPPQSGDTTPTKPKSTSKKNKARDVTPSSPGPLSPGREPKSPAHRLAKPRASHDSHASIHAPGISKSRARIRDSALQSLTRAALKHTAADLEEWEAVASRQAMGCAKALVDRTTELDNALSILPSGAQPQSRIVGPRLKEVDSRRVELRGYLVDLDCSFTLIAERVTNLESILAKLTERDGLESVENNPLWNETSWPFARCVSHMLKLLRHLNRTRHTLNSLADAIVAYSLSESETRKPETTFAQARTALASWSGEASRTSEVIKEWVETSVVEVPAWDEIQVGSEREDEYELEAL